MWPIVAACSVGFGIAAGCADDSGSIGVPKKVTGTTLKGGIASSAAPGTAASPTPAAAASATPNAPSATPNTGTDITSGVDQTGGTEPLETLAPVVVPSPTPTPIGALGNLFVVGGGPRYLAFLANDVRPHILRDSELVTLDNTGAVKMAGVSAIEARGLAADGLQDLYVLSGGITPKVDRYERVPGGLALGASFPAPGSPVGLAAGEGEAWVAVADGKVMRVRKSDDTFAVYEGFESPTSVALGPTEAWVTSSTAKVFRIARETGAKVAEYPTGAGPVGVAIDASGSAWIANAGGSSATRVAADGQISTISLGAIPTAVVAGARRVWFALPGKLTYYRFDGTKEGEAIVEVVDPEGPRYPLNPEALAIDADGRVWTLDRTRGEAMPVWGRKVDD